MLNWITKSGVVVGSFLGWMALFQWTGIFLKRYFCHHQREISQHHIMNVCEATVCIIQSVLTSLFGIIIVLSCRHDVMGATNSLSTWYALVLASYFIYDTIAMYKVHLCSLTNVPRSFLGCMTSYIKRRALLVAHHVVIAFILCPVLVYRDGIGDFFVGCFYCVELSGPFTNMRIVLSRFGLKDSKWYVSNGIAMIVSFALCRIMLIPYMYITYGYTYQLNVIEVIRKIPLHCNLGCLLVLLPQIHWLRLMILGAVKLCKGKSITESDEKID
ncbi:TLC domain-containing protein 3A-like isoform X1 [Palaemon carinicauda]|uniref:TLC domain-containing protein 3A-like isoform X1 n=1 Tax=Palaemon carinicauda TaxID=392227 RepID=UPI0035B65638